MARVIRPARIIPRETHAAITEAEAIVEAAREEAARLIHTEHRRLEEEARRQATAELAASTVALEAARRAVLDSVRSEVGALAIEVAKKAIRVELSQRPELLAELVGQALERVRRASVVRVRVHPDDAAQIEGVPVVPDERLSRGDCVVESDLGEIDGRIDTRLDALARALDGRPE